MAERPSPSADRLPLADRAMAEQWQNKDAPSADRLPLAGRAMAQQWQNKDAPSAEILRTLCQQ